MTWMLFVGASLAAHVDAGLFTHTRGDRAPRPGILATALKLDSADDSRGRIRGLRNQVKGDARTLSDATRGDEPGVQRFAALNSWFFGPHGYAGLRDAKVLEGTSVAATLEARRGPCVTLAIVYLELARRLGLDARGVATPDHLFVRIHLPGGVRNVELLEAGRHIEDDTYRRRHRIDPAAVESGVYLRELSDDEVLAHLLSNQGIWLSRQGRIDEALARYERALKMAPRVQPAWYNRGLDLLNAGRLEEAIASFDRAIELHAWDAQAHNNRGLAKMKMGDVEGARLDWLRALELHPGQKEAETNLKRLTEGASVP